MPVINGDLLYLHPWRSSDMITKPKTGRFPDLFHKPESVLLTLSLFAAVTATVTFYDWVSIWGWDSPLTYSVGLFIAALVLCSGKWWGYLLAASLCLLIFYDLSRDMFLEWREYWSADAGFRDATGQALLPLWEPMHAVLSAIIFCYVAFKSIRHLLRYRMK